MVKAAKREMMIEWIKRKVATYPNERYVFDDILLTLYIEDGKLMAKAENTVSDVKESCYETVNMLYNLCLISNM
jgi:hypothetical protein